MWFVVEFCEDYHLNILDTSISLSSVSKEYHYFPCILNCHLFNSNPLDPLVQRPAAMSMFALIREKIQAFLGLMFNQG